MALSLSQHKISKKKIKNLRNVLVLSTNTFWPLASESDSNVLKDKLRSCLVPVKINIPRAPWYLIRSLPKEERNKQHEKILKAQTPEEIESYYNAINLRKYLFLGVNSLCKAIERRVVSACLVDADVSPKILVSHVIELAQNTDVPVLAVSSLKETLKSVLGFSSLALGFKKDVEDDNNHSFHETCMYIINKAEARGNTVEKLTIDTPKSLGQFHSTVNDKESKDLIINEEMNIVSKTTSHSPLNISAVLEDIYLHRETETVRVFKPLGNHTTQASNVDEKMADDIIHLSPTSDKISDNVCDIRYFKPPIIHKIQSNPKKKKLKIKKKKI